MKYFAITLPKHHAYKAIQLSDDLSTSVETMNIFSEKDNKTPELFTNATWTGNICVRALFTEEKTAEVLGIAKGYGYELDVHEHDRLKELEYQNLCPPARDGVTQKRLEEVFVVDSMGEDEFFDDLSELIRDKSLQVGDEVIRAKPIYPKPTDFIDVSGVMEDMEQRAYDECGDFAEGFVDESEEAREELEDLLSYWANRHCVVNFYLTEDEYRYKITEEDVKKARSS